MTATTLPAAERTSVRAALRPVPLLRLEGVAMAVVAVGLYGRTGAGWWLFAALLLVPDLGMLGYLVGPRVGAATYNLTHALPVPLVVAAVGLWAGSAMAVAVALVWVAHIGIDRALGYGLKHPTDFGDTHLGRVGRS
jgi:hypothetical protein